MRSKRYFKILSASAGLITVSAVLSANIALADQLTWTGTTSTDWTDGSNWSNAGVSGQAPASGDSVTVEGSTTAAIYNNLGTPVPAIDDLIVGDTANGSLDIENALNSNTAEIGNANGADGSIIISGSLGNWTNGDLTVSVAGIGTLTVTAGAQYTGSGTTVAANAGSSGSISVSGGGSFFQTTGPFVIGDGGTGSFEVVTGATAESDDATLGGSGGSTGSATISGNGSVWTVDNQLTVGDSGTGSLTIATGGNATATTTTIGNGAGSDGSSVSISGSGSSFDTSGLLTVGGSGDASLNIYSGATATSGSAVVGDSADGTVTVAGLGSAWTSGGLTLGLAAGASGTLVISDAGEVDSDTATLGDAAGSSGTVKANGSGSLFSVANTLTVGGGGTGTISVTNSGAVEADDAVLGASAGSSGNVLVTGSGSIWTDSGTLTIGDAGSGTFAISLGGALDAADITLGNAINSTGSLTVTGDGSVASSSGTITVGETGNGTLTVADGGTLSADTLDIATGAGSTGIVNFGAAFGSTAGGIGNLDVDSINFGSGDGTLVFNFGGSYTLTAAISGNGEIDLASGALTLSGDSSNFTGVTTLYGGSLVVDGTLGGSIVLDGGTLTGSGTIGSASFASGSTVSAGGTGSIGTLTVNGSLSLASGATYSADLTSSSSDVIHVTGAATLSGGTVVGAFRGSGLTKYQTYTILTADGGVSGTFDGVSSSYTFLASSLGYTSNDVTLTLERNGVSFASVGTTHNERAAGAAIDSINSGTLYNSILSLGADEARSAFGQLAGAVHASIAAANFDNSRFVSNVAVDRMRSAFGGVGAATGTVYVFGGPTPANHSGLAYGPADNTSNTPAAQATAAILADPDTARAVVWGQAYGGWSRNGGDANASGLTASTGGIVMGMDAPLADTTWRFGLLAAYSHNNYQQSDDSASADSDGYDIGIYGGNRWGLVSLRLGATYGRQSISTRRTVTYTDFNETLSADYTAQTAQAFGELAYAMKAGPVELEPFANLAYVHQQNGSFSESGGAAALSSEASDAGITYTTLGLHAATDASFGEIKATAHGTLGWRHAFGDRQTASTFSFAGSDAFTTYGDVIAADSLVIEAGLDMALSPLSTIGLTYSGLYGGGSLSQTIKLGLAVRF